MYLLDDCELLYYALPTGEPDLSHFRDVSLSIINFNFDDIMDAYGRRVPNKLKHKFWDGREKSIKPAFWDDSNAQLREEVWQTLFTTDIYDMDLEDEDDI